MNQEAINKARSVYYGLFSSLFTFNDEKKDVKNILKSIDVLNQNPLDEYSNNAFNIMKKILEESGEKALQDESNLVFFSLTTQTIPVSASFYDESRDDGKKRVEMSEYVLKSKYRKDTSTCKESEDHIGFILSFMHKLIEEEISGDKDSALLAREVFINILNAMVDEFMQNVYQHEESVFYKQLVISMKVFIDFERMFYDVKEPEKKSREVVEEIKKPKEFKKRAKRNFDEFTTV
ncbi:TorD/DmsD family molecular chaperone [Sulfurospirillum arcachonense]|uniref:TorD/DmsD family molecular chaperone n=1 Tax=Sulfurospirillum arcachonense TaxID=57666 RepID=UPI00046AD66C|nr:molecular chaperone TorD family protein [Sulfurospirillum arcachonense]